MQDRVLIEGLEIRTVIGIYDWEREIRQTVRLDLEMAWDITRAAASDDIADTLDYASVSMRLVEFVEQSRFSLLETLAKECADLVIREFGVGWLRIRARKALPQLGIQYAGVELERSGEPA